MRRMFAVLLIFCLVPLAVEPVHAKKKKKRNGSHDAKQHLKLQADAQAGFAPVLVHFTARLMNVEADDRRFCHAGTFLMQLEGKDEHRIVAGENPACLHAPDQAEVPLIFSYTLNLGRAGHYEFAAMIVTDEGQRMLSNAVPVRVLSSPSGH